MVQDLEGMGFTVVHFGQGYKDIPTNPKEGWILRIQKFREGIDLWFCTHFSAERIISCQGTDENPGFSFTKRESRLQMGNLVYKTRISFTKWDSWSTNGTLGLLPQL